MGVNTMNETTNKPINNAGRIGFNIRGYYSENDTYDFLDVVYYGNSSYVAKQTTVGNTPAENNAFWQILARGIGENVDTPNYWKLTSQNGKGVFEQNGTTWIVTVPTMAQASDAATAWWMVKLSTITEYTVKFGIVGGTDDDSAYVNVSSTTNSHYQFSKVGNGEAVREVKLPKDAWVWMKFQHYSNTADAHAYLILEPVVLIDEQRPTFTQAATRTNIASGNSMNILFGKIMKWFADFKNVAFTGSYNDLSNKPTIPAAVAVKGNAESTYRTGNVNLTPANIGAVATSKVLSTKEQINANTNTANVAGATAVKAMVSEINSKLAAAWADATTTDNVVDGVIQWHQWGLLCEIIVAVSISMPEAWDELKIATNLPPSRFGSGARGIIQSQETGLAYCIIITSNGELFVRTDTHPQSGWYRGAIIYITTG